MTDSIQGDVPIFPFDQLSTDLDSDTFGRTYSASGATSPAQTVWIDNSIAITHFPTITKAKHGISIA